MKNKKILAIDLVLIVGTLIVLGSLYNYSRPVAFSPGEPVGESAVLFRIGGVDTFLIDDNKEFSSPREIAIEDGAVLNLEPGFYYWMLEGEAESEIRWFRIVSRVSLEFRESGDWFVLVNAGEEGLSVEVYEGIDDEVGSESFILRGGENE